MSSLRLLIVDDEPLVRDGIRHGLSTRNDITILGECGSGREAIEAIQSLSPDLVLLDVQMHDLTGLQVIETLGPQQMPPVVFITAYDEYAVRAFELNAVDYLLKPFDGARLNQSIDRAAAMIALRETAPYVERLQSLLASQERKWPERIVVRDGERFDLVPVDSIEWIEAANNYVQLHCGGKHYLLSETLTHLEGRLDPAKFLRIHRGKIIHTGRIASIHTLLSGTYEIELRSGMRLTTGRQYKDTIQSALLQ